MFVSIAVHSDLEYKFLVKSVDPDATTSVTGRQSIPDHVLLSSNELDQEWEDYEDEDGEMSTPAPATPEGSPPIRTGNLHYFSSAH